MSIKIRQISLQDLPLIAGFHKEAFPLLCEYFFCKLTEGKINKLPKHAVEEKYYLKADLNEHS